MKHKAVLVFLILVIMATSVKPTYASIPKVHNMGTSREGDDVIVTIEIAHSGRSEEHYVDIVETTMNGKTLNFTELEPQTAYRFSLNGTFHDCEGSELEVRAHCVTHGWSNWVKTASVGGQVAERTNPEEPAWDTLVALLTLVSLFVLMKWRKMIP
jgi:desulfoferrodoxin (superoxide reductase-like protein)